ncbi:MAG TPA: pyridoxamine 5'-phosphate oxidase [Prolixibacteraceae bacterium]|nr:pyridoxamine 5'-phosphate oxidase [Prolixibacteraceae bacterium]
MKISEIRKNYSKATLSEKSLRDPFPLFGKWLEEAIEGKVNEPTAMMLSTVSEEGRPSSRIVLLKHLTRQGFHFFTNYNSRKGREIKANSQVALLFFWPELEREVRIEGIATISSAELSDQYFSERPYDSQISAIVSRQSEPVGSREVLEQLWKELEHSSKGEKLIRPVEWGGYFVEPERIEFWQGRPNRLHDRILFVRNQEQWIVSRLAP